MTDIEHLDWHACIERYDWPHALSYLDPPYWKTEGYGVDFPFTEYERIAEMMRRQMPVPAVDVAGRQSANAPVVFWASRYAPRS